MATPQEMAAEVQCVACSGAATLFEAYEIVTLKNILSALGTTMTQAEINSESSCFMCEGMSLAEANIIVLLNEIQTVMTGGGSGAVSPNISGAGSPVGVVTPDAINQFYRDTTGGALWQSTGLLNTNWIQWV